MFFSFVKKKNAGTTSLLPYVDFFCAGATPFSRAVVTKFQWLVLTFPGDFLGFFRGFRFSIHGHKTKNFKFRKILGCIYKKKLGPSIYLFTTDPEKKNDASFFLK